MVNEVCAGDSLERMIILGSTNSVAYGYPFRLQSCLLLPFSFRYDLHLTFLLTYLLYY
jgi:hypothetical protein